MATRKELNAEAAKLGIAGAEKLKTKADVEAAITAAQSRPQHFADGTPAFVISVFGPPGGRRCLIEVSAATAEDLFQQPLASVARFHTIEAVERDIAAIAERDLKVAESGMAAAAVRLAYELENPYNSATSKAQCAKSLRELIERLLEEAPAEEKEDEVSRIGASRSSRIDGGSGAAD